MASSCRKSTTEKRRSSEVIYRTCVCFHYQIMYIIVLIPQLVRLG